MQCSKTKRKNLKFVNSTTGYLLAPWEKKLFVSVYLFLFIIMSQETVLNISVLHVSLQVKTIIGF